MAKTKRQSHRRKAMRKRSMRKRSMRKRSMQKATLRGGSDFNVPIRAFYPQNSFEHDPSREMQTSLMKGGKKHSRKYLNQRRKFTKKMRGGLHLTYGYIGREYNDSSENDESTRVLLREKMDNDPLYSNKSYAQKTLIINNTIDALRVLRDSDNQPTNNLTHYEQDSSRIFSISLINYLFPNQQPSPQSASEVLQSQIAYLQRRLNEQQMRAMPPPPPQSQQPPPQQPPQQPPQMSIPELTINSQTIVINYEMKDHTKNFYISERKNVFETLFENRTSFIDKKPFFKYLNISEQSVYDEGTDAGGLTTHVFSLLSNFFTGSSELSCSESSTSASSTSASSTSASSTSKRYSDYFVEYNGFYILNNIEEELSSERRDRLYFIGQLFASAIKLRQIIEINLHPLLLYQMLNNDFDSITPAKILKIIKEYGLSDLLDTHPFSCFKEEITDINCNFDEMGLEITDKSGEAMNFLKSKMDNPSVKAFIEGFQNIINVGTTTLNELPLKKFSELISGSDIKLNYENLMKHLKFVGFSVEQLTAVKDLIKEKSDSEPDWVRAFLFAITNKNKIPISGFPSDKQLRIELKSLGTEQPPFIVHTCFNNMDLNKSALDEYINSTDKKKTKLYEYFNIETFKSIADHFNIA